jgi:hypothetical protein
MFSSAAIITLVHGDRENPHGEYGGRVAAVAGTR